MSAVLEVDTPPRPVAAGTRLRARASRLTCPASRSASWPANSASPSATSSSSRRTRIRGARAPRCARAIAAATDELCRYPDGNGFALKAALSAKYGVAPDRIVLGNGSNDVLELVTQAFLRPGDHAVYSRHAFAVYPLAVQARGATGIEVPARDYGHDLPAMRAAITPATRVVFVANPNNPTGTWIAPDALRGVHRVDPAMTSWSCWTRRTTNISSRSRTRPAPHGPERTPNLIVSRTFSKAYGLAALRVGYGIMNANVADMLNRVRQPFNVNALAQAAALAALADTAYVDESRALNRAGMRELEDGVRALGLSFVPSHGNFLLVHVGDAARASTSAC